MHHIDRETPWEEIWQAMEVLVQQGKVLYVGSSNFAGWHLAAANENAKSRHFMGLISEQSKYNLLTRDVELEVVPACTAYGLGLNPWSPLAGGALAGFARKAGTLPSRRDDDWTQSSRKKHAARIGLFEELCRSIEQEPADVALAWLLAQPAVCAPIIGPRTAEQLEGALHALDLRLDPETLKKIDEICPGPGGAAPEAYAW
jgi:aryl-alcohol dehydrogenase-like predicted oxidoreductase